MDDEETRIADLEKKAADLRVHALEVTRGLAEEFTGIWNSLNELADGRPDVRRRCDEIARDIAQLERLDVSLDTEWLIQSRRDHAEDENVAE